MKKKVFLIIGALVAVIAAWMILFPGKNPLTILSAKKATTPAPASGTAAAPTTTAADSKGFPILADPHNFSGDVSRVQRDLNLYFILPEQLVVDGLLGPKTLAALRACGFAADGSLNYDDFSFITDREV